MDEATWLSATDPQPMLNFLRGKVSDRKLRLFAVACCRLLLVAVQVRPGARREVDVAERYAEGAASVRELEDARYYSISLAEHACRNSAELEAAVEMADAAALNAAWGAAWAECAAINSAWAAETHYSMAPDDEGLRAVLDARIRADQARQCTLLRDIVANPFAPSSRLDPAWLKWQDATVPRMATAIYDERAFGQMPVLADALMDAGCDDEAVLAHCRKQGGVHARGCWVLDLLLGKE